jgi:hypothetical protein
MDQYNARDLEAFHKAVQTLKLYRRAEIENDRGDNLIDDLYVDPLPNDHIYHTMLKPNTTIIVGRKGTGKSTIFQRAQRGLRSNKRFMSTYVDIKTVFESAQVDAGALERLSAENNAMAPEDIRRLLLLRSFLRSVIAGIREDMEAQLKSGWRRRLRETFTGTLSEQFFSLDEFVNELDSADFINVQGIMTTTQAIERSTETRSETKASAGITAGTQLGARAGLEDSDAVASMDKSSSEYSTILLRVIDVRDLINRLQAILETVGVRHLVIFIDDFSELPAPAMETVVDVLLAPLNNWSQELVKFKVAAYPGRVYLGQIDKSKIDEISLDTFSLYGQSNVADMESKAIDFTRRLLETRLQFFGTSLERFRESKSDRDLWRLLFYVSMGNPRTLGYILFFAYESHLIYRRPLL